MGFLSHLLGKQSSELKNPQNITVEGLGTYPIQIVGESHYQESLKKIYGNTENSKVEVVKQATLIHDNHNKYDRNAIRVEIEGMTVGYLSRDLVCSYREYLRNNENAGKNVICKAKLTGDCHANISDSAHIGVALDLPTGFLQLVNTDVQNPSNQNENKDEKEIIFELQNCSKEDLASCKIGDSISLWMPKDGKQQINIYRPGSIGGQGRLGFIPKEYFGDISSQLNQNLDYETEIVDINIPKSRCKIIITLVSKQETEARLEKHLTEVRNKLSAELQKKYKPKNSLIIRVSLPKDHSLKAGQELSIEKQPMDYYIQKASNLRINFVDNNGVIIAYKYNEPKLIISILRAYFSQCPMRITIDSIDKPDKYTLKYMTEIEAKVVVSFDNCA